MSTVRELHSQSMRMAQEALIARERGNQELAAQLASEALPFEMEAAERIPKRPESEPTRSILYRSAASLAYQANDYSLAQRLVFEGLSGWPPPHVEDELKQLYDQINFAAHLRVRDIVLEGAQLQLALAGDLVGSGQIAYKAFQDRIEALISLLDRTMRRLMGQSYQRSGRTSERVRPFEPFISTPRIGSFAVTVEMAHRKDTTRSFLVTGESVISEVVSCISLVEDNRIDVLREKLNDEGYFVNFLSMAQKLAPDGNKVTLVGLTTTHQEVSFTRPKRSVFVPPPPATTVELPQPLPLVLEGVLDEGSMRTGLIGFTVDSGEQLELRVRAGMDDLVRSYFNRRVQITTYIDEGTRTISNVIEIDDE